MPSISTSKSKSHCMELQQDQMICIIIVQDSSPDFYFYFNFKLDEIKYSRITTITTKSEKQEASDLCIIKYQ